MDFFQQPRYVLNKRLLSLIGLWPYQNKRHMRFFFCLTVMSSCSLWIIQLRTIVIKYNVPAVLVEAVPPLIVHVGAMVKAINCICTFDKFQHLLRHIQSDWQTPMGPEEQIVARFSDDGRTFSIIYAAWLYISLILFLLVPFAPKIIVACGFANISTEYQLPIPVDYFVDSQDNFIYIQLHLCISIFFIITIYVSVDTMFVVLVQHASGIFSAIGYRLEHLAESEDIHVDLHPPYATDETYWIVVDCIVKHKEAIEFSDDLDDVYSGAFLILLVINIPVMSFTALQVIWGMDRPAEATRQGMLTVCELLHLFFECFFSQRLTNHSLHVYESLNKIKWYNTSIRTRKLLIFIIMRSMTPVVLKAGKMYTMSMENFSALVRTSMSYFTLLLSLQ